MKKLQSNYKSYYTTPEQSKKLLELGLPANSADCYNVIDSDVYNKDDIRVRQNDYEISSSFFNNKHYNPCWSVGKLIEIYEICTQRKFNRRNQTDDLVYLSPIEDVMMQIEHNACGFYSNSKKWDTNLLNK